MALPAYTEWPIFKQLFWLFCHMINGIYNVLDTFGIANMGLVIIIATVIFQLLFLPSNILMEIAGRKNKLKSREMNELLYKYKNGTSTQEEKVAFDKDKTEIEKRYKKRTTHGCLCAIVRFVILFCFLNVMSFAQIYIQALAEMNPEQLKEAFTFCGVYLLQTPESNYVPLIIIPISYCAIHIIGNLLRTYVERREDEQYNESVRWIEENKTEEEREVEEEERQMRKKKDPLVITKYILKIVDPLINFWFAAVTHVTVGLYLMTGSVFVTITKIVTILVCQIRMKSVKIAFGP